MMGPNQIFKITVSIVTVCCFYSSTQAQDLTFLDYKGTGLEAEITSNFQLDFIGMSKHILFDSNKTVHNLRLIDEEVRSNQNFNSDFYLFIGGSSEALRIRPDALIDPDFNKLKYGRFVTVGDSQVGLGYDLQKNIALTFSYFVRGNSYKNYSFDENVAAMSLTLR